MSFITGLGIGLILGVIVGIFLSALCMAAKCADEDMPKPPGYGKVPRNG